MAVAVVAANLVHGLMDGQLVILLTQPPARLLQHPIWLVREEVVLQWLEQAAINVPPLAAPSLHARLRQQEESV
jgi:hypothetical protein